MKRSSRRGHHLLCLEARSGASCVHLRRARGADLSLCLFCTTSEGRSVCRAFLLSTRDTPNRLDARERWSRRRPRKRRRPRAPPSAAPSPWQRSASRVRRRRSSRRRRPRDALARSAPFAWADRRAFPRPLYPSRPLERELPAEGPRRRRRLGAPLAGAPRTRP